MFVTASIVIVPHLGVVLLVGAVLFGQLVSSVLIDHFGLVGMEQQRANWGRLLGVALLLAGVILIQRSTPRAAPERRPDVPAHAEDAAALTTQTAASIERDAS